MNIDLLILIKMPDMEEVEAERRERARAEISNPWWLDKKTKNYGGTDLPKVKTYLVQYCRNSGEWDAMTASFPIFVFYASRDRDARELAYGYMVKERVGSEYFKIDNLSQLKVKNKQGKLEFIARELKVDEEKPIQKDIQIRVVNANFQKMQDFLLKNGKN